MEPQRVWWIDCAKAYGMLLVFYAHFLKNIYFQTPYDFVFDQIKLIYSFHMPLFFLLAGTVHKPESDTGLFAKRMFRSRIVPYLFFNAIFMCGRLVEAFMAHQPINFASFSYELIQIMRGHPVYCWLLWFVVCLGSTEIIHHFNSKLVKNRHANTAVAFSIFIIGTVLSSDAVKLPFILVKILNSYFIREAMVAYPFFYIGTLLGHLEFGKRSAAGIAFGFAVVLFMTFNTNGGPFGDVIPTVNMQTQSGQHGNPILFPITALAGSMFIIGISHLSPANRLLAVVGRSTLSLLALNTLFYQGVNERIIRSLTAVFASGNEVSITGAALITSALTIISCLPFIAILDRRCPTMLGKRKPIPATAK